MKIPPKLAFVVGLWTSILLAIGSGTVTLPLGIPHDWIDYVKSWCVFWGLINSMVLTAAAGWSAPMGGPLAKPPTLGEARDIMTQAGVAAKAEPLKQPPVPSVQVKP
jgi:hypothetical protein